MTCILIVCYKDKKYLIESVTETLSMELSIVFEMSSTNVILYHIIFMGIWDGIIYDKLLIHQKLSDLRT